MQAIGRRPKRSRRSDVFGRQPISTGTCAAWCCRGCSGAAQTASRHSSKCRHQPMKRRRWRCTTVAVRPSQLVGRHESRWFCSASRQPAGAQQATSRRPAMRQQLWAGAGRACWQPRQRRLRQRRLRQRGRGARRADPVRLVASGRVWSRLVARTGGAHPPHDSACGRCNPPSPAHACRSSERAATLSLQRHAARRFGVSGRDRPG